VQAPRSNSWSNTKTNAGGSFNADLETKNVKSAKNRTVTIAGTLKIISL
jgi:hypothetical protein